jgi:hypothetical protein
MKIIVENVAHLLYVKESLRNDDRLLIFEYWRTFDRTHIPLKALRALDDFVERITPDRTVTSPATIIRVRQKLQSDGYFLPTNPEIIRKRDKQEIKLRIWLG